jgi:hypothetical protein
LELLFALVIFVAGMGLGVALDTRRLTLGAHYPEQGRRLAELRRAVAADTGRERVTPRLELAEYHLERRCVREAGQALGGLIQNRSDDAVVRSTARRVLRGILLHEVREEGGRPAGLLPQDMNWHPGAKRLVMRLKDLTLGGLVELKHLDVHIDDFEPLMRTQPLPRIMACRAVIREERLAFVLDSRIDWSETPMEDFRILFREGQIHVLGTFRLLFPIGFRLTAVTTITGASRLRLSFPHPPRVAGLVPLPIDTVLKVVARKIEEMFPGLVWSDEEATLEVDILKAGLPPVDLNLREIRVQEGRFEVLCAAEEIDAEALEVLRLPSPQELLPAPTEPTELAKWDEEDLPEEELSAAPGGFLGGLAAMFQGKSLGAVEQARQDAQTLRETGDLRGALGVLVKAAEWDAVTLEDSLSAPLFEDLAALRLDLGGGSNRSQARMLLEDLLSHHPQRGRASLLLGRAHQELGEMQVAEERTRLGCQLLPFEASGYRQMEILLEQRGAARAAARAREIHLLLDADCLPALEGGETSQPRGTLFHEGYRELLHPEERSPTGDLVSSLQGTLSWLDPTSLPVRGEHSIRPLTQECHPRLLRLVEELARGFQVETPQILLYEGGEAREVRVCGASNPWMEGNDATLQELDEGAMAFELGRCLQQLRSGRGFLLGLEEDQLDLLFALLRAVSEEAHRLDTRPGRFRGRTLERVVGDTVDTLAHGWVVRGKDLDPWVPKDIRIGARQEALEFHDTRPGYLDLVTWQWSLEASADRAGLLVAGSVGAALRGMRLAPSPFWAEVEEAGLTALAPRVREDRLAYRVQELLRFAVERSLEDLERDLFS